jgi:hypothetical protein
MKIKMLFIFCYCFCLTCVSQAQSADSIYKEEVLQVDTSVVIEEEFSGIPLNKKPVDVDSEKAVLTATVFVVEEHPLKLSGFVPPASLMLYALTIKGNSGLYSSKNIRTDMRSTFPGFYTPLDNYIAEVPFVTAFVTGFIPGAKPRHSNGRRLWVFLQAQVITSVAVLALKSLTHEDRPDGSNNLSFPSGHAAQAFMGAALFDAEYPNQLKAVKIGLYALAGITGALRMMNDKHWANDVLFGAGIGILSVRLLYWSEQHWKKKKTVPR